MGYLSRIAFPVYRPRTYISAGYQGTLGYGYPAALGAQLACPDASVVALSGDGGFSFSLQELATASQFRIPVVAVVFNDGAYGNILRSRIESGTSMEGCVLANPDFVRLAVSFGVAGYRAYDHASLFAALTKAIDAREPALIEVPIGQLPSPWPLLHLPRIR
jgi:acetolactate synthase-1/2/3 large subunit